jgi:hypothetical protein
VDRFVESETTWIQKGKILINADSQCSEKQTDLKLQYCDFLPRLTYIAVYFQRGDALLFGYSHHCVHAQVRIKSNLIAFTFCLLLKGKWNFIV